MSVRVLFADDQIPSGEAEEKKTREEIIRVLKPRYPDIEERYEKDAEWFRGLMQYLEQREGLTIIPAKSLAEARRLLHERDNFHVAVIDVSWYGDPGPEVEERKEAGLQILRELQEENQRSSVHRPVIAFSQSFKNDQELFGKVWRYGALPILKDYTETGYRLLCGAIQALSYRIGSVSRRVFVVHGHDEAAKQTVARFLERLKLEPVILSEQPNEGRTIIEKFEANADVSYAVVLLTPDDTGYPHDKPDLAHARARQNVVLELGYFLGSLKRKKVCALHKGSTELPSDMHGVVYLPMDDAGGWKLKLADELRRAGLEVDLNRAS